MKSGRLLPFPTPLGGPEATRRLVERIHQANSLAKVAHGASRRRLYRIKQEGVLRYAELYPDRVYVTSLDRVEGGGYMFGIAGFGLGRCHLIVNDPWIILKRFQLSASLQRKLQLISA